VNEIILKTFAERQKASVTEPFFPLGEVSIRPRRNDLLNWLYDKNVVEASEFSAHLFDKLFFAQFLKLASPEAYEEFHPRTSGLSEYLSRENAREAILGDFPDGFVVKAVGGMNSSGTGVLMDEAFFTALEKNPADFISSGSDPGELTGIISSGERFLVQEKIGTRQGEYRLHTLEDRVVRGATYTRWDQDWDRFIFTAAENALERFLHMLPKYMTSKQAWSFDFMGSPETGFKIVEVNTNRGRRKHWSGDLEIPDTLAAYTNHLESHYGALFLGEAGEELRNGVASGARHLEKFDAAAVARHLELKAQLGPRI
jgi:hypothetical protein